MENDLENDLSVNYELGQEYDVESELPKAHMPFAVAFLFGAWYSSIFGAAVTSGVKYLHPETPNSHGLLESLAWAIGSGIAIALASRLSKAHRFAVGLGSSFVSASVWVALLFSLGGNLDEASGEGFLGYSISIGHYLIGFSLLVLLVGIAGAALGANSRKDEELTSDILQIPSRHWLWLWIPGFAWMSMLPMMAYYIWLQLATALYSIVHPSLWFQAGSSLFFGFLGIAALSGGIGISLKAVSDKKFIRRCSLETGVDVPCWYHRPCVSCCPVSP